MKIILFPFVIFLFLMVSCQKEDVIDDIVAENLRITSSTLDTLKVGEDFQFEAMFTNNVGIEEDVSLTWASQDTTIATIEETTGLATARMEGATYISVFYESNTTILRDSFQLVVGDTTVLSEEQTLRGSFTGAYDIKGSFEVSQEGEGIVINILSDYAHDGGAPGPYLYLTNNINSIAGALEIGNVNDLGAHEFDVLNVGLLDYQYLVVWCKPFNIRIGYGEIGME